MEFDDTADVVRRRMARIRKTDSKPETKVRQLAHALGYRFRKNCHGLPGTPDIVFPSRRKIIFVHGCFWHQHSGCRLAKQPASRKDYWLPKLRRTVERDAEIELTLTALGWNLLTIWECEVWDAEHIQAELHSFLG